MWINRDIVPHTATANDGSWDSQELEEGSSWEMVVVNTGLQDYVCEFHPHMKGVLEAREETGWRAQRERFTESLRPDTVEPSAPMLEKERIGLGLSSKY